MSVSDPAVVEEAAPALPISSAAGPAGVAAAAAAVAASPSTPLPSKEAAALPQWALPQSPFYDQAQALDVAASALAYQQALPQSQVGGHVFLAHPPLPHFASMIHPMNLQYAMLNPQLQQMIPQQEHMMIFQQQLLAQLMVYQSMQMQFLQQFRPQPYVFPHAATALSLNLQHTLGHGAVESMIDPSTIHHQLFNQSQYDAAVAQAYCALPGQSYCNQAALPIQPSMTGVPSAPYPFNLDLQGISPSAAETIRQADESIHEGQNYGNHYDEDDDIEVFDEDDFDDNDSVRPSRTLLRLVEDHQWFEALQQIIAHPHETQQVGMQGRTPLHIACDHDAPPALVQALLSTWPVGAERVGTSHMNPLHITCSSPHASVDIVRILLAGCRDSRMITGARDVDGDTPLHAACRCAAPMDVLVTLLQANPITVTWKDYEGLNPLMRLWVRYFVLVGEHIISNIKHPSDVKEDLIEAWEKSLLLLQVMGAMENRGGGEQNLAPFRAVHTASAVDCPRCVVRIAMVLFPQELLMRDECNRLPIHIAAASPVYCVHDLRGEGFTMYDAFPDDDPQQRAARPRMESQSKYKEPSVIDILLSGDPAAASQRDPHGQLPLHIAIMRGKTLDEGVQALVNASPDALTTPDNQTNLYPFMLAASIGRGRGDCSTIYALLRAAPDLVHMALQIRPHVDGRGETTDVERNLPAIKSDS